MLTLIFIYVLCGFISDTTSLENIKYPVDADVYIGAFIGVYRPSGEDCSSNVDHYSIQEYESMRWIIDKINHIHLLPGLKIGIHAFITCGVPEKAVTAAIELKEMYSNNASSLLFGLLSPVKSVEAMAVSRFFKSIPREDRLLMLSFGATATALTYQTQFQNFFRIIPPDKIQVQVMLQLMLKLKWNYVAIIYEDDDYGKEAAGHLRTLALDNKMCIPLYQSFTGQTSRVSFKKFITELLKLSIRGIVYIGSSADMKHFLQTLEPSWDIEIIMSESTRLIPSLFQRVGNDYFPIARGVLVPSAPRLGIAEFSTYWATVIQTHNSSNAWVNDISTSDIDVNEQSVYVSYAVKSVLILADLFKTIQKQTCVQLQDVVCSFLRILPKQKYVYEMTRLRTNLTDAFPFTAEFFRDAVSENITFNNEHELDYEVDSQTESYTVYNLQQCHGLSDCQFVKVGKFLNQTLHLNISLIQAYPMEDDADPYQQLPAAQCPDDRNCLACIPSNLSDQLVYLEGDWYVVAVVPVYSKNDSNPLQCNPTIREDVGNDIAESIRFAIEEINNLSHPYNSLLQGQRIGLIVINGCGSELVIKEKILRLHKGTYHVRPWLNSSEINHRILGYVGGLSSSMSTAMAGVLTKLGYIQVSFGSTSPLLSDRNQYPYFLRIPTEDNQQAKVIIDIIQSLKSNIFQVIYTEGAYGEGGFLSLKNHGEKKGICAIGYKIPVTGEASLYNGLLAHLRHRPGAKIVVMFIRTPQVVHAIKAVIEHMSHQEFLFIGSETWGIRKNILDLTESSKLSGSMSISLELPPIQGLEMFMSQQNINDPSDPWLRPFLENKGKCFFPGSFKRHGKMNNDGSLNQCNLEDFLDTKFQQDPWIPFAVAATQALIIGVKDVLETKSCRQPSYRPPCSQRSAKSLADNMKKNVKLDLYNKGTPKRVFNDNGDGVVDYIIYTIEEEKISGKLEYKPVGSSSRVPQLNFEDEQLTDLIDKYQSNCLSKHECNECPKTKQSEMGDNSDKQWMIYTMCGFGVLSLLLLIVVVIMSRVLSRKMNTEEPHYVEPKTERNNYSRQLHNQVSNTSTIYLTAQSSLGIEPYDNISPPTPCRSIPHMQGISEIQTEQPIEEASSGFDEVASFADWNE